MFFIYNQLLYIAWGVLKIAALFSPKLTLFVKGRKNVFALLEERVQPGNKTIWFHAASLGEYEQGLPVMERIRQEHPEHKIVLTFFSPSGYEVRRNTNAADIVVYLPMDTTRNARKFIRLVHPDMAFFVKYEYWPNYLKELKKAAIPSYLVSGLFREKQVFFKSYGGFYRQALTAFTHFFVQDADSKKLLQNIGYHNVTVSGDTRFDRVSEILQRDNTLPFIEEFSNGSTNVVFGSSWPKDEAMFAGFINNSNNIKFIIAPHTTDAGHIKEIKTAINRKAVLFSEKEGKDLAGYDVFIIDTIGILGKIYSYADIAYVGGGFGTSGLHNILEPAAFGIPVVIGPNHEKYPEAAAMIHFGGCLEANGKNSLENILDELIKNDDYRSETGHKAGMFISMNRGAVDIIMKKIR
ncbi:3-deoxy-D-manno-octulosonic acid transferase [Flavobacterium cyanobacteriorum]|uniref:3-deoxy-D-manno-octulosonic acid transferase n=1 Tax=Flavobacterium cyanobacteriorum TaxID=2022802 RepID=A0A255ZXL0_9FLAO|nr:glycosyltransferase N-terminal domain-containing protein [Flavobacterium cyanobacteriorum]OYQ45624.1 3-deoxy-D-manno-octulosonic acid transferase [Flavobacterium cyanobacteriorum]